MLAQARAHPDTFPALARKWSKDPSASADGLIQPIHHHVGDPQVEQTVFSLRDGEISPIVKVADQYLIFKAEGRMPAEQANYKVVRDQLAELVRDGKLRKVGSDTFKALQKQAVVQNVYNDPAKSREMPGIAAIINGRQITLRELSEECIDRHGIEVLEGTINRHLLEQAMRAKKLTITQPDTRRRDRAAPPSRWARRPATAKPTSKPGSTWSPRSSTSATTCTFATRFGRRLR